MDDVWTLVGAGAFGAVIGWLVYYINRYRKGDVQLGDLTTIIGIVGGAGITRLFGGGDQALFGAYGIGLFVGFFAYFATLIFLVRASAPAFGWAWFLDGRRKPPKDNGDEIPAEAQQPVRNFDPEPATAQWVASLDGRVGCIEEAMRPK